ncbi:HSP20 family protein [Kitasatospora sp. MAA19]|uniref:Hsp20/alpha crystallin family protein n=1 Tax=Kitasatospora sp. MAA19 TaxID=3035090 RepID=UPI00247584FA|nr:Hsp20/alpha crystallin family protein [Kitasatospora sp. MAA19]MDH6708293.1 HSP20 family protein [Kitasatospora sp. MAA19]
MSVRTAVTHQAPPRPWSQPAPIPMDAWREDDRFVIALDLPGIPLEGIEVQALGRMVTVKAERRSTPRGEGVRTQHAERAHGVFERRIQLADSLDPGRIAAHLQDGVLTITVPIASASRRRKITVQTGAADQSPDTIGQAVPAAG